MCERITHTRIHTRAGRVIPSLPNNLSYPFPSVYTHEEGHRPAPSAMSNALHCEGVGTRTLIPKEC